MTTLEKKIEEGLENAKANRKRDDMATLEECVTNIIGFLKVNGMFKPADGVSLQYMKSTLEILIRQCIRFELDKAKADRREMVERIRKSGLQIKGLENDLEDKGVWVLISPKEIRSGDTPNYLMVIDAKILDDELNYEKNEK